MPLAAAEINLHCLSIEKDLISSMQAVGRVWKISQSSQKNTLDGSIQNNIGVIIEKIGRCMCDGSDDCFESDGDSHHPNVFDTNKPNTSNDTRDGS